MKPRLVLLLSLLGISACGQLPPRTDGISLNAVPNLDPTLIPSNNGLLSSGINQVPGSYCFAGADGKCDPTRLSPKQCLFTNATVEVAPKTNPTPSYDALIDYKYSAGLTGVPFINATASAEFFDEVKAVIAGTAVISTNSPNNGYPGVAGLKACILSDFGPGTYGVVFWISAANILDVTINHFKQVSSTAGVTATAFGLNGSTYDHSGSTEEKIWIGLQASQIQIGAISAPGAAPTAQLTGHFALPKALFVTLPNAPEPLPPSTKASFVRQ